MRLNLKKYRKQFKKNLLENKLNKLAAHYDKIAVNNEKLQSYDKDKYNNAKIVFGFSSRFRGNHSCFLENALDSIFAMSTNKADVAALIAIDKDDALAFFQEYKDKHPDANVRFIISPERYGIEGLHKYDRIIYNNLPEKCKTFFDYSDDASITLQGYDEFLLDIDSKFPDGIYIIHSREDRYGFLPDMGKNPMLVPWLQKTLSPASLFPIFSKRIIEIADKTVSDLGVSDEWTPLANSWICDCYLDYIAHYIKAHGLKDRVFYKDMIARNIKKDKFLTHYVKDDREMDKADRAFVKMYSSDSVKVLNSICENIVKAVN